jgi:hypothetical protein
MSWFKSKKSRQLETEKADIEREQFAQKAKSVEADMLEFLNAGIAFAQKQTNDAHRQIIANFVETLGKLAQLLFKNLEKKNKAQLFLLLPKMMCAFSDFEQANEALENAKPEMVQCAQFEAAAKKLGEMMELAMKQTLP